MGGDGELAGTEADNAIGERRVPIARPAGRRHPERAQDHRHGTPHHRWAIIAERAAEIGGGGAPSIVSLSERSVGCVVGIGQLVVLSLAHASQPDPEPPASGRAPPGRGNARAAYRTT